MSKLIDKLTAAERERFEKDKSAGEVAQARMGEERRGLDLAAAEEQARRAEAKAASALNSRISVERKAEARANARAESETAALAALESKIAAGEALAGQQATTSAAVERAEEAARLRAENRRILAGYRKLWRLGWSPIAFLALAAAGAYFLWQPAPPTPAAVDAEAGAPFKLKLDYRLR